MESYPSPNLAWWPIPVVSIPGRWKQEDQELRLSLGQKMSSRPAWIHKTLSPKKYVWYKRGAEGVAQWASGCASIKTWVCIPSTSVKEPGEKSTIDSWPSQEGKFYIQ